MGSLGLSPFSSTTYCHVPPNLDYFGMHVLVTWEDGGLGDLTIFRKDLEKGGSIIRWKVPEPAGGLHASGRDIIIGSLKNNRYFILQRFIYNYIEYYIIL